LIAGVIIGPYTPPFSLVSKLDILEAVADLGVILLLFAIGLEFPLAKLRSVGLRIYIGISVIEIALMFIVSYGIGWMLGWSLTDSLFLGAALASSSTVIIMKALRDLGKLKDVSALVMMGVLIAEDLIVVLMLSVITSVVGTGSSASSDLAWNIGKMLLFVFGASIIGVLIIPRLIHWVARPESTRDDKAVHDEVLMLVALGLCFGLAMLSNAAGLSVAIGAFLMGVFVASTRTADRVTTIISPIKDMFAAIFFVSMGAFIDVTQFQDFLVPALIVTAMMVTGKIVG
jgi:CPA2 family monovalent cation:H+ antiporter-2